MLRLPHTVPFIHISFPHLNANPVSKCSTEFQIQNAILFTPLGLVDASSKAAKVDGMEGEGADLMMAVAVVI